MKVFAFQYCEEDGVLIGIRFYVTEPILRIDRIKLGAHGVTDRSGTCESGSLSHTNLTKAVIFTESLS